MTGRTVLIIAHDEETLNLAHKIAVLESSPGTNSNDMHKHTRLVMCMKVTEAPACFQMAVVRLSKR